MAVSLTLLREQQLMNLARKTGYEIHQHNGQRRYGPPPSWIGPPPPKGSEIFIGKLPRDLYEDELVPLFERIGVIYELRLMMDFSGSNRGFAFLMYTNPSDAERAIIELDNHEIRGGRKIGVCKSVDNCRLFVGGIPKDKTSKEIYAEFSRLTEGVKDVILYNNLIDKKKNRGFAFIEYDCHRSAAMARRKLIPGKITLWGHELAVDWAEPEPQVKSEVMNRVTVLFARNLTLNTTEEKLQKIFSFSGALKLEKVKKMKDYAFIHYVSRDEAEFALASLNGRVVDNCVMEVTWSKPPECSLKQQSNHYSVGGYRSYPRHCLAMNPIVSPNLTCPRNFHQDILPHGFGAPDSSSDFSMNLRSRCPGVIGDTTPRCNGLTSRLFCNGESPTAPACVGAMGDNLQKRKNLIFQYPQILSYLCLEKGFGKPVFKILSITNDTLDQPSLYTCKVIIPNLPSGANEYICSKFSRTPEEAEVNAAQYVINILGLSEECLDFYVQCSRNGTETKSPSSQQYGLSFDFGQGDGLGRVLANQPHVGMQASNSHLAGRDQGDTFMPLSSASNAFHKNGIHCHLNHSNPMTNGSEFGSPGREENLPQSSTWMNKSDNSEDLFCYFGNEDKFGFKGCGTCTV